MIRRAHAIGALAAVVAALAALPACNILAPAAYLLGGLPKKPAEYVLEDRPTVVFVDDRANVISSNARAVRMTIAESITRELMENELVTTVISSRDAIGYALAHDRHGELLAIDEIGRRVGAEQVIFVQMSMFSGTSDGVTPKPTAGVRVRVIDAVRQVRLFPSADLNESSRPVSVSLPPVDPSVFRSQATRLKVYEALAEETGNAVARLFYEHVPNEIGRNLNPR